jgi:hypothetical protein
MGVLTKAGLELDGSVSIVLVSGGTTADEVLVESELELEGCTGVALV